MGGYHGKFSFDTFSHKRGVLERDLKTSTSVEGTKAFLQLAQMSPFEARGQVFVIASAESLTGEAANALLKTLEEPPSRTPRNFILLTPSQLDLLPTIRSRSLPVYLGAGEGPDAAQVGDLAESLFKRDFEVKDASRNLPGLGGVLDVVDSLLFTIPLFYFYVKLLL